MKINKQQFLMLLEAKGELDQFGYYGWSRLWDWYNDLGLIDEITFDPVAFRCDWSKYDSIDEMVEDFGLNFDNIKKEHIVIKIKNGYLVSNI